MKYQFAINYMGEGSLEENLDLIKKVGYEGLFFGWTPNVWSNRRNVLAARERDLTVTSFHSPYVHMKYIWRNDDPRAELTTEEQLVCLRHCAALEVPVMIIHAFCGFLDHEPTEIGLERYGRIIEEAERLGVMLGFENTEGDEYLAAIFDRYRDCPSVGFCFDTGHELVYNGGKDMMALYGEKLVHTHFNDNQGPLPVDCVQNTYYYDLHQVMGDGKVDWKGVMNRIEKVGYQGFLTCELSKNGRDHYPGTHDRYRAMTFEEYLTYTYDRMVSVVERKL